MKTNSKPLSFADLSQRKKDKITRTGAFLENVKKVINLDFTDDIHETLHNNGSEAGRKPYSAELMFKIILLQQWFGLSDAQAEEMIYDRKSFQNFLELSADDDIPDETTIGRFRNALIDHEMAGTFFEEVECQLKRHGLNVENGKIVDATITEVPKGRKKGDGTSTRDTDASFTKKRNQTYHGYKCHIATDTRGKYITACHTSTAKDPDNQHEDKVLDGDEKAVFEDSAYASKEKKKAFRAAGKFYGIVERAYRNRPLTNSQKKRNKKISSVRCRGEHPFAEIKCRMNFTSRYRGSIKNEWQHRMVCAAYNLKRLVGSIIPAQKQAVVWCT